MHRQFLAQRGTITSMALLAPSAKEQRRIRLEFHLAAITDPVIKDALLKADAMATEHATSMLNSLFGIPNFLLSQMLVRRFTFTLKKTEKNFAV
jgi:hypothetical protein